MAYIISTHSAYLPGVAPDELSETCQTSALDLPNLGHFTPHTRGRRAHNTVHKSDTQKRNVPSFFLPSYHLPNYSNRFFPPLSLSLLPKISLPIKFLHRFDLDLGGDPAEPVCLLPLYLPWEGTWPIWFYPYALSACRAGKFCFYVCAYSNQRPGMFLPTCLSRYLPSVYVLPCASRPSNEKPFAITFNDVVPNIEVLTHLPMYFMYVCVGKGGLCTYIYLGRYYVGR
ncbi:uncharacterized protein GGS25DRAFT_413002 [Hypoxylon fragiforme]|uniref:uncharacterized protein n=1 Tax=Hypoxylon fragiforme TaxID=63214 RepID=UPI0020C5E285|nr:uncharacterized protein GGS25DRAFT_413002 [Hypoxylon fragiforme]KAI2605062.1 hypothetical protein GGS25DRAFT_413002 [Hypoxylon fragiforme]